MSSVHVSSAVSGDVTVIQQGADQRFKTIQTLTLGSHPAPMCFNPTDSTLCIAQRGEPASLAICHANKDNGLLQAPTHIPLAARASYLGLHPRMQSLVAVSYHGHGLQTFRLQDGLPHIDSARWIPTLRHPHCVVFSASGRHAVVACLGDDASCVFKTHPELGDLGDAPLLRVNTRAGAGPRHVCFHPNQRHLYVIHELDASVDVWDWDDAHGQLAHRQTVSIWPSGAVGAPWAADLQMSPDGRWLYTCERRTSTLTVFAVDADKGQLTQVTQMQTETQPRSMALDAKGTHLFVAGQLSHHLACYAIDGSSGFCELQQRIPTGQEPGWVLCSP
jgi:6-phosphogluconolactonase